MSPVTVANGLVWSMSHGEFDTVTDRQTHTHTHTHTSRHTSVTDLSNSTEKSSSNPCDIALWSVIIPEYGTNHCSQQQSSPIDSTLADFNYTPSTFRQLNTYLPSNKQRYTGTLLSNDSVTLPLTI